MSSKDEQVIDQMKSDSETKRTDEHKILIEQFITFSKFGDSKSTGQSINLRNIDKWFKQANAITTKGVTTADTGIYFNKIAKPNSRGKNNLTFQEFNTFLETLAKAKKMEVEELKAKLVTCGDPGTAGTTQTVKVGGVDRLTDTSKYTERCPKLFNVPNFAKSGKGKGAEGRSDRHKNIGYVGAYKGAGTDEKNIKRSSHVVLQECFI